jgi:hypothetical protein
MRAWPAALPGLGLLVVAMTALGDENAPETAKGAAPHAKVQSLLKLTPPIACRSIDGYESYEVLPGASLTSDEKLLVYYRPSGYRVEQLGGTAHFHLTQDGQIRRRGEKTVLMRKEKIVEYEVKGDEALGPTYARNTISLKGLKPGEYEFDVILHDRLDEGASATQSLRFRVIPAVLPKTEQGEPPDDAPAKPAPTRKNKAKRGARSTRSSRTN